MADKPAEPGGEEEKDGKEKEKTCGEKYEACIIFTFKWIYKILLWIVQAIRAAIAFVWYPLKEQCSRCFNCCDRTLNPWKDEGYSHV